MSRWAEYDYLYSEEAPVVEQPQVPELLYVEVLRVLYNLACRAAAVHMSVNRGMFQQDIKIATFGMNTAVEGQHTISEKWLKRIGATEQWNTQDHIYNVRTLFEYWLLNTGGYTLASTEELTINQVVQAQHLVDMAAIWIGHTQRPRELVVLAVKEMINDGRLKLIEGTRSVVTLVAGKVQTYSKVD